MSRGAGRTTEDAPGPTPVGGVPGLQEVVSSCDSGVSGSEAPQGQGQGQPACRPQRQWEEVRAELEPERQEGLTPGPPGRSQGLLAGESPPQAPEASPRWET